MTTATVRQALAPIGRLGVLAALAWVAAPAQSQDLGLMLRFAHAQPGAAVMLAQLRLRQTVAPAPLPAAGSAERRALPTAAAQPVLAVTAVAAAAARPPLVAMR